MKVVFLTGEYPPMQGGIADYIANLAGQLAPLHIDSSILITRRWLDTFYQPANQPQPRSTTRIHPILPNWSWRCWPAITKFLNQHRPDILHIQYQAAAFELGGWINWLPWYLKKRGAAPKIITTFHDLRIPYIFPKAGSIRWKSILALARYSDAVICTNYEDAQTLRTNLPTNQSSGNQLTAPPVSVIPLGSNVEPQPPPEFDRMAWRSKYQAAENTLLLAYFGFLNESKGGEELIEAVALLRQQGLDAQLLLIGGDIGHADRTNIAYAKQVNRLIDQYELEAFVHRTGYVELPEVSASFLAADAVVLPFRDGVSFRRTTLIAALRHGCPVVSTVPANPGLVPEIQPEENMLLAPPQDAAELARTIAPLADNTTLRKKLSEGAKKLGGLFEWQRIAEETVRVYQPGNVDAV